LEIRKLELLEERIRSAAMLIRTLRQERSSLERRLEERESEIEELRASLSEASTARPDPATMRELETLRGERREVLARVEKMLSLLDEAAALSGQEDLLAAVDDAG
jgi:hypothetical protein